MGEIKKYPEVPFKNFLGDYLHDECGIQNLNKAFHCLNDNHHDEHPSMTYSESRGTCHCWACGKTYNIVNLVMEREHKTYKEAIDYLKDKYGDKVNDVNFSQKITNYSNVKKQNARDDITVDLENSYRKNCYTKPSDDVLKEDWEKETVDYLNTRGFKNSQMIMRQTGIKKINNRIYIPHIHFIESKKNRYCTDYIYRSLDPNEKIRYMRQKGAETSLFTTNDLLVNGELKKWIPDYANKNNFIFITEGEFDSLTIEDMYLRKLKDAEVEFAEIEKQQGSRNIFKDYKEYIDYKYNIRIFSVGLSSTGNVDKFIKQIESIPYEDRRNLIFIPLCDNDNAGKLTNEKLFNFFQKEKLFCIKDVMFIDPKYKDINDYYKSENENCYQKFSDFVNKSKTYADFLRGTLFEEKYNYLIDEFEGKKRIRFIQATAYDLTEDGDTLSKHSFRRNCIETRRFCFSKKDSNVIKDMKKVEEELKKAFFEKCGNKNDCRVVVSTGTYWFDKNQTRNIKTCLGKLSTNKIYRNVAEWKENEGNKYDRGLRNNMIISSYDTKGEQISYKIFKGGKETTEEEIIKLEEERIKSRNQIVGGNENGTSKIEND